VTSTDLIAAAPNGVRWRRKPGGRTTPAELFATLDALVADRIARDWNLWKPGAVKAEHDKRDAVLDEWDHAEPPPGGYKYETDEQLQTEWDARDAERKRERDTRAEAYDHDLAMARLRMFQQQATAGFMRHVLANPASGAQRATAEERLATAEQESASLAARVGDPDAVADKLGYLPAERRGWHRSSLFDWRHRTLRELKGWRFNAVLAMPAPAKADMCSECEAPADWHTYAVSLCLYRGAPEPGSQAETIARLLPGWWERCAACTPYPLEHRWGGRDVLPGFGADQWATMLPPLLRALFAPDYSPPRKPRAKPDPRRTLQRRIREAERQAADLRKRLAALDPNEPEP
jgi:hypothetical protein